ncbi:MAG: SDR family oxidoreductase [Holosporales bacterium]|jgi:NAD(P)-dependent dehydrogenase (short-subunit alcohol dehydrogenase family)|nr:SDR family oxidoreductase [Holosporales bacterium]
MLHDKVIVVAGGCGLIGRAVVKDIRSKGSSCINFDTAVDGDLDNYSLKCDISDYNSVKQSISEVIARFGRLDGLVNCAYPRTRDFSGRFDEISVESWTKNVDLQLNSVFYTCFEALKVMKKQKAGSVVNFGSIYGVVGNDFNIYENTDMQPHAAYTAIKGGVINFTRYLASYFGKFCIRANCVSPGGVFDNQSPIFVKQYSKKCPLNRMAKPEEVAPAVSFLLSDEAGYITGHNLMVDGGWCAV